MMLVAATLILLLLDIGNVLANQCFPRSYLIIKGGPSLPADEIISKHNITSLHVMLGCHNLCKDEDKCVGFNYRTTKNVENCQLTNVTKEREKVKTGDWVLMLDIEATKNEKRKRENVNGSADIDECSNISAKVCHSKASCINTNGSYNCTCLSGYSGNGKNCTDIDECSNISAKVCHRNASCSNTNGSYNCTCLSGYSGNGKNCTDIDECSAETHNCHSKANCTNTDGSYDCQCLSGFFDNGTECLVHELDSDIMAAESPEFKKTLAEWLPVTGKWSVCWRATFTDKSKTEIFHDRCDSKVPTLTVVKMVKNGKSFIFGGFATVTWAVTNGTLSAPGSFLFSFRNNDGLAPFKSPLKDSNNKYAIQSNKDSGPKFGTGPDLSIFDKYTSQKEYKCYANLGASYETPPGYIFGESKTQSLLAGSLTFTPAKVEVLYLN